MFDLGKVLNPTVYLGFPMMKTIWLQIIANIHFIWTLVDNCLIANHTSLLSSTHSISKELAWKIP